MSFSYAQKTPKKDKTTPKTAQLQTGAADEYFMDGVRYALTDDHKKALSAFEQSLKINPKNAAAHYKMAEILLQQERYEAAIGHAREALALDKENQWYYMVLAEAQLRSGNSADAAATVEGMMSRSGAAPHNYLKLAQIYLQLNQTDKALTALNKAEKELGIDEGIVELKQRLYLSQNKLADALAEGEKLVAHYPTESSYALRQARLLLNVERYADAQKYLQTYLEKHPQDAEANYLLAKAYEAQQQPRQASEYLIKAFASPELDIQIKLQEMARLIPQLAQRPELEGSLEQMAATIREAHPADAQAYAISGDLAIARNQKQQARASYLQALQQEENNFEVWQNVLTLGLELGRYDSVAREADQALMLFPNQAALYYFSGAANLSLDKFDEAAMALEQGKRLAAANKQLISIFNSHLGDAYNGLKRYDLSDAAYEAALAFDPNNAYILNNYSYYLALRGDKLPLALEMSKKLVAQHPTNPNYLDTHAWVLYRLGKFDQALPHLQNALKEAAGNDDGTILEHYGDVLFRLGRVDEALQQWKKALTKPGVSAQLEKKIKDRKLYE
ncbi:tetratricopeptide repeat protein [Cesiribacter andamanensis]|uniref:Cellulose synthase subunit BcsC n=1 Tax=Cesiribacter andamanensis AMV16 TaxID=1279009 RepID=M7N7F0_9BACT|nr:tetratricopeptide repeat protein [Cesiribacter andamanensis]EMR04538.1 cellulose synthase subunit BcsC [Cesiribacter andamanensis AMV16]